MNKRIQKKKAKQTGLRLTREECGFAALGKVFCDRITEVLATPSRTNLLFATEQELLNEFNRNHSWVRTRF